MQGMPESPVQNLTLQNVAFTADWADDYSSRRKPVGGRRSTQDEREYPVRPPAVVRDDRACPGTDGGKTFVLSSPPMPTSSFRAPRCR